MLRLLACAALAATAVAQSCAPSGVDCYPSSFYASDVTEESCLAQNCCWLGASANPPCQFASRPAPSAATCAAVAMPSRLDCMREALVNAGECASRGCCYSPVFEDDGVTPLEGVAWCFHAPTTGYVLQAQPAPTDLGFTANLTLAQAGPYGNDALIVQLQVMQETQTRLHFKLTDPSTPRWELPPGLIVQDPAPSEPPSETDYDVSVTEPPEPFGILVTRKGSGQVLFDSRVSSNPGSNGLVFSPQYLELTTALPTPTGPNHGINVYGIGEHIGPFQLPFNYTAASAAGWAYTLLAKDQGTPVAQPGGGQSLYGQHPFYMVLDTATGEAFGVVLINSNAMDVLLQPDSLTYRVTGGVLDVYLLSGPSPAEVSEQYFQLIGRPYMPPRWALGYHLCRWGYGSLANTTAVWQAMRAIDFPQDSQWNDIDYMDRYLDFTVDPVNYPVTAFQEFVAQVHAAGQHYVQIVDPGISSTQAPGSYPPWDEGLAAGVFMTDAQNQTLIGQVWPGLVGFPDWFSPNASAWWKAQFARHMIQNVPVDGAWIDMNEPSNFCTGECPPSLTAADAKQAAEAHIAARVQRLQERAAALEAAEKEGRGPLVGKPGYGGPVTGVPAPKHGAQMPAGRSLRASKRAAAPSSVPASASAGVAPFDPRYPPYIPGQVGGVNDMNQKTVSMDAQGSLSVQYNVHGLFGFMEGQWTRDAMEELRGERALVISRSTFIGSGSRNGHWLGDNTAQWADLYYSLPGVMSMNLFGIPLVGADVCGFGGDSTTPELCTRWHQLGAFTYGFFRDHNSIGKPGQAPSDFAPAYSSIMRQAVLARYALLPYWYTLFASAHMSGSLVTQPLFYVWPTDAQAAVIDTQVMLGDALLVSPVLQQGAVIVPAYFPAGVWYSWWTGAPATDNSSAPIVAPGWANLTAPLDTIPVHILGGSIVPTQQPNTTTVLQEANPFSLTVALDADGNAQGSLYWDDGVMIDAIEQGAFTLATFTAVTNKAFKAAKGSISSVVIAGYQPPATAGVAAIRVLGVGAAPSTATINGVGAKLSYDPSTLVLTVTAAGAPAPITQPIEVQWQ